MADGPLGKSNMGVCTIIFGKFFFDMSWGEILRVHQF